MCKFVESSHSRTKKDAAARCKEWWAYVCLYEIAHTLKFVTIKVVLTERYAQEDALIIC